jgi:hypothetical protein
MWTWLLNPKNALLATLSILLVAAGFAVLWERNSVLSLTSVNEKLASENLTQREVIDQLQMNITQIKLNADRQQKIEQATGRLMQDVAKIDEKISLGEYENKVAASITAHFNTSGFGVSGQDNSARPAEVLPKTDKASVASPNNGKDVGR